MPASRLLLPLSLLLALGATALADGNVRGKVKSGRLTLKGDAEDNILELEEVGYRAIRVRGYDGTRINGSSSRTFYGVDEDIVVKLGSGDDEVLIDSVYVHDDLRIKGQGGDDLIILDDVYVDDDLVVGGNSGRDEIVLDEVLVEGETTLKGGKDRDDVYVDDSLFGHDFEFRGGSGSDDLVVTTCDFYDGACFAMGDGDDEHFIGSGTWLYDDSEFDGGDDTDFLDFGAVFFWWGVDVDIDDYEYFSY